ncbi:MAG: hypothetical protein JWN30_2738 [Bacilli bacterium]|nr:hypothetical protein [Bacilli bacterium]
MDILYAFLQANVNLILLGILVIQIILIIAVLGTTRRAKKLNRRYELLLKGSTAENLEELLVEYTKEVKGLQHKYDACEKQLKTTTDTIKSKVGKIGVVRYNAYADGGNDLSFSVAMLDGQDNGVVLTSFYGREDTRVYAKPLKDGGSVYPLTEEEKEAILITKSSS